MVYGSMMSDLGRESHWMDVLFGMTSTTVTIDCREVVKNLAMTGIYWNQIDLTCSSLRVSETPLDLRKNKHVFAF